MGFRITLQPEVRDVLRRAGEIVEQTPDQVLGEAVERAIDQLADALEGSQGDVLAHPA